MDGYADKPFEAFRVGDRASVTRTIDEAEVEAFAALTGDRHPAHFEGTEASASRYGRPVVHGLLTASLLSAANASLLGVPGAISIEQSVRFLRPVFVGDTITATSEVVEILMRQRWLRCRTVCRNQRGERVLDGWAIEMKDLPATG